MGTLRRKLSNGKGIPSGEANRQAGSASRGHADSPDLTAGTLTLTIPPRSGSDLVQTLTGPAHTVTNTYEATRDAHMNMISAQRHTRGHFRPQGRFATVTDTPLQMRMERLCRRSMSVGAVSFSF